MNFIELLLNLKEGQLVKATFGKENWHIIKTKYGFIRECSDDGKDKYQTVQLTPSTLGAEYRII